MSNYLHTLFILVFVWILAACQAPQRLPEPVAPVAEVSLHERQRQVAELNRLGVMARQNGQFESARNFYKQALEVLPDEGVSHRNLGILYDLYLGQKTLAERHYEAYLQYLEGLPESDEGRSEIKVVKRWLGDLRRQIKAQIEDEAS